MEAPIRVGSGFETRYPGARASATELAMNLVRTASMIESAVADLVRPLGLSPASGLVLAILADADGPRSPSYIGERLIVTRATVTGLIDSLERRGFVVRRPSTTDRRGLLVELTATGRLQSEEMRRRVHREQATWMRCLDPDEQTALTDALGRVQRALAAYRGDTKSGASTKRRADP